MWCNKTDGGLIGLTYLRDQEVLGWHLHYIGGADTKTIAVESVPGTTNDQLWAINERTINGSTVKYIEKMAEPFKDTPIEEATFMDSFMTFPGLSSDTVTGLNHLEGETVVPLVDGGVHPTVTVTAGVATLNKEYGNVNIGLPYTQRVKSMPLEGASPIGSTQGSRGRVTELVLKFFETVGCRYGATNAGTLQELDFRKPSDPQDEGVPLFTGQKNVKPKRGFADTLQIEVEQAQPLPMTLLGYVAKVDTSDSA